MEAPNQAGAGPDHLRTGACFRYERLDRYRNVTICSLVHVRFGLKASADVPLVMRCSTAQATASR